MILFTNMIDIVEERGCAMERPVCLSPARVKS